MTREKCERFTHNLLTGSSVKGKSTSAQHNVCYNIFVTPLFSVVLNLSTIYFLKNLFFILTYDELKPQLIVKILTICYAHKRTLISPQNSCSSTDWHFLIFLIETLMVQIPLRNFLSFLFFFHLRFNIV